MVCDEEFEALKKGSEREFDEGPILRRFPDMLKFNEFGIGHGHAFGLQQ
jgi:hypothetical protein